MTWDNGPNVLDGIHLAYIENPKVGINKINLPDLTYTSTSLHLYDNFSIWLHPDSANSDITIASRESSLTPPRIVCFFELSDLPIILASIVIVAVLSIGGYLSYYLLKNRRKTNKD